MWDAWAGFQAVLCFPERLEPQPLPRAQWAGDARPLLQAAQASTQLEIKPPLLEPVAPRVHASMISDRHPDFHPGRVASVVGLLPEANGQRWASRHCPWHEGAQIRGGLCNHATSRWKLQA
jgi:hypothetical protein